MQRPDWLLIQMFETEKEKCLVFQMAVGQHWPPDIEALIPIMVNRLSYAFRIKDRFVGIQAPVAGIEVPFAVELCRTALADGAKGHRPVGVLGVKCRRLDGHFLGHVLVDVGDLRSLVSGVRNHRAIHD